MDTAGAGAGARRGRRRGQALALLAVASLLGLSACVPQPYKAPTSITWRYVGGDEFDGTSLDTSKWRAYHNTYGDGNNELACLTPNNVKVSSGTLKITARKQTVTCPNGSVDRYTSGFLGSRDVGRYYPRFGRFEMRARVPHAQGLWPAFWLRHRNGAGTAEVDIMEYFHTEQPGQTRGSLHLNGVYNLVRKAVPFESTRSGVGGWHVWAVEIRPTSGGVLFEFFLDGVRYNSYTDTLHRWDYADPNATWDIAVNLAVGGNWVGWPDGILGALQDVGRCAQGGTYPNACNTTGLRRVDWTAPAATTYEVDWVRVYTRG